MPLVAVLLLMRRWFIPHNYRQLGLQLFIAMVVYGVGMVWAVLTKRVFHVGDLGGGGGLAEAVTPVTADAEVYQADA